MRYSKSVILAELEYIQDNYEFSPDCSEELSDYLLTKMLVDRYEGELMVTTEGELFLGVPKEELRDMYEPAEGFFHEFHYQESEVYNENNEEEEYDED